RLVGWLAHALARADLASFAGRVALGNALSALAREAGRADRIARAGRRRGRRRRSRSLRRPRALHDERRVDEHAHGVRVHRLLETDDRVRAGPAGLATKLIDAH